VQHDVLTAPCRNAERHQRISALICPLLSDPSTAMARATTPCQMLRSSSAGWRRRSGLGAVARRHPATSLYPTTGLEGGLSIASVFWTGWCATQWEAHWSHKRIDAAVAACRGHGMLSAGLVSAVTANLCWPYEGADPAASDRNAPPFGQGGRSAGLVGLAIDEMTFGKISPVHAQTEIWWQRRDQASFQRSRGSDRSIIP